MGRAAQPSLFGPLEVEDTTSLMEAVGVHVVRVALESGPDRLFDYAVPGPLVGRLQVGQRVRVPVGRGNRLAVAFCVEFPAQADVERVKPVKEVVDAESFVNETMMRLARWIGKYYCAPLGTVLAAMVPGAVKQQAGVRQKKMVRLPNGPCKDPSKAQQAQHAEPDKPTRISATGQAILDFLHAQAPPGESLGLDEVSQAVGCTAAPFKTLARAGLVEIHHEPVLNPTGEVPHLPEASAEPVTLNPDQQTALEQACQCIDEGGFHALLLHGVTGSGKTEIYLRCVDKVLAAGRQALVLVPEIGLTPQTVGRFLSRFHQVAVLHSQLAGAQRHQQWRMIAQGQAQVVVGARSAVFAPLTRLGLIVIDEEHEPGYKQDNAPRYHARNVAIKLAQMLGITVILGSATPSLETYHNCQSKQHYRRLLLPRRVLDLPLPPVSIVDMQQETAERPGRHLLSRMLEHELRATLARGKQAILLLNRRGHSNYVFCPSCKYALACPHCDVNLTYHAPRAKGQEPTRRAVMCHYCGHTAQTPTQCPVCSTKLVLIGPGTQRAEDELQRKFPQARYCRVDSDSMKVKAYTHVLQEFGQGRLDVLLGTQMVGKGLDFPAVTLVGVLSGDTVLSLPDFRSSERTFALIAQVAGRCGRGSADSRVIVQTYLPQEPAINLACRHDYDTFAQRELEMRRRCRMPPHGRLARIVLRDRKLEKVETAGQRLRQHIDQLREELAVALRVRGPLPATLARLEGYHRWQLLLQADGAEPIQRLLQALRQQHLPATGVHTAVDMDPINLL